MCNLNLRVLVNLPKQVPTATNFLTFTFDARFARRSLGQLRGKGLDRKTRKARKSEWDVRHVVHTIAVQPEAKILVLSFHKEFNVLTDTVHTISQRIGFYSQHPIAQKQF